MNHWSSPYSYSKLTNFTIDNNTVERYDYNFFRDLMLCTFVIWMFGHFLEGFEEHLRRHRNENENDDDDLGFDFFDYMMFFD